MASRDVELIIRARDQASAVAKTVTDSFRQLATAETQVGAAAEPTSNLLNELKTQLAALQASATGLSGFARVSTSIDRADASLTRLETNAARANDAMQRAGLGAQSQTLALTRAKIASDDAAKAIDRQRVALTALQEQQRRQQGSVTLAQRVGNVEGSSPAEVAKLAALNTAVRQANAEITVATRNFNSLQKEVAAAENALGRSNAAFQRSAAIASAESTAVDHARLELAALKTEAATTGEALGGVATNQDAITAASQRNAQALQQVAAAIQQERAAIAAAQSAGNTGGAAEQATAAYRAQIAAVNAAKSAWQQATQTVAQLATQIRNTANPTAELKAQFTLAKVAAGEAKANFESLGAALQVTRNGIVAASAARSEAIAKEQAEAATVRAAAAALDKYNNSLIGTIRNLIGLKNPADQAAAAIARASAAAARANNAAAGGANGAFLGLTPSKLQNLSFQINDVITQLASGTSIQQTLAQQSAQVGQLFPAFNNLLITGLRLLPVLALVAAALAPFVAAVGTLQAQAENTRHFNAELEATGQTAVATGRQLADTATALDQYGLSMKDALAVEEQFLNQGFAVDHFEQLGRAARNLAPALGTDVPQAAQRLSAAINGNLDDVLRLDSQLNFLTHTERERIRALNESTDASTAATRQSEQRTIVEQALLRQSDTIASQSRGPWAQAARELGRAWNDLVNAIAQSGVFQEAGRQLDELARKTQQFARDFRTGLAFLTNGFNGQAAVNQVQQTDRAANRTNDPLDPNSQAAQRANEARVASQRQFNDQLAREQASRDRIAAATRQGRVAAAQQRAEEELLTRAISEHVTVSAAQIQQARDNAAAQERANQASRAGASEAQSAARRQQQFNLEITRGNAERALQIQLIGETARQQAIDNAVQQASIRADQQRVTLSEAQRQSVRDSAAALFDAQQAQGQRNNLLEQEIQLRQLLHQQVSVQQQIEEEALLQNIDLTSDYGRAWAAARSRVVETSNAVDNLSRAQQNVSALAGSLSERQRELAEAFRNGESQQQLDARIAAINQLRDQLVQARDAAIEMARALGDEETLHRLEAINTTVNTTRESILTAAQASQNLAEGLSNGIGDAAIEIGKAIDGTNSWADSLSNIGDIFRQFAADFLKQIAQMIIQALILRAIQSSGAGGFISGIVGGLTRHGGGFVNNGGTSRNVNPGVFANAPRFHVGGIAGLNQDEVPAILKKNEEVLTRDDPRHAMNGGKSGGIGSVKVVNVLDGGDVLQHGLASATGERAFFNFLANNKEAVNGALAK